MPLNAVDRHILECLAIQISRVADALEQEALEQRAQKRSNPNTQEIELSYDGEPGLARIRGLTMAETQRLEQLRGRFGK